MIGPIFLYPYIPTSLLDFRFCRKLKILKQHCREDQNLFLPVWTLRTEEHTSFKKKKNFTEPTHATPLSLKKNSSHVHICTIFMILYSIGSWMRDICASLRVIIIKKVTQTIKIRHEKIATVNLLRIPVAQSDPLTQLVNCEKLF